MPSNEKRVSWPQSGHHCWQSARQTTVKYYGSIFGEPNRLALTPNCRSVIDLASNAGLATLAPRPTRGSRRAPRGQRGLVTARGWYCPQSLRLPLRLVAPAPRLGRDLYGLGRHWPPLMRLSGARSSVPPPSASPPSLRPLKIPSLLPSRLRALGRSPWRTSAFPPLSLPATRRPLPLSPPSRFALLPPLRSLRSLPVGFSFRP